MSDEPDSKDFAEIWPREPSMTGLVVSPIRKDPTPVSDFWIEPHSGSPFYFPYFPVSLKLRICLVDTVQQGDSVDWNGDALTRFGLLPRAMNTARPGVRPMTLRLVLVSLVAALGISLPGGPVIENWVASTQNWMNARFA